MGLMRHVWFVFAPEVTPARDDQCTYFSACGFAFESSGWRLTLAADALGGLAELALDVPYSTPAALLADPPAPMALMQGWSGVCNAWFTLGYVLQDARYVGIMAFSDRDLDDLKAHLARHGLSVSRFLLELRRHMGADVLVAASEHGPGIGQLYGALSDPAAQPLTWTEVGMVVAPDLRLFAPFDSQSKKYTEFSDDTRIVLVGWPYRDAGGEPSKTWREKS